MEKIERKDWGVKRERKRERQEDAAGEDVEKIIVTRPVYSEWEVSYVGFGLDGYISWGNQIKSCVN